MASSIYNRGKAYVGAQGWITPVFKVMLITSAYAFNVDHDFVSDLGAVELTGTGYTAGFGGAGRKTLGTKAVNVNDTDNRAEFDAADLTWTAINAGTAAAAVVIHEATSDADSELIAYLDPSDIVTNGGDYTITWPTTGLFYLT